MLRLVWWIEMSSMQIELHDCWQGMKMVSQATLEPSWKWGAIILWFLQMSSLIYHGDLLGNLHPNPTHKYIFKCSCPTVYVWQEHFRCTFGTSCFDCLAQSHLSCEIWFKIIWGRASGELFELYTKYEVAGLLLGHEIITPLQKTFYNVLCFHNDVWHLQNPEPARDFWWKGAFVESNYCIYANLQIGI